MVLVACHMDVWDSSGAQLQWLYQTFNFVTSQGQNRNC
jgi:hypothetical protein